MLPNKRKLKKKLFFDFSLFWHFLTFFGQKQPKLSKKEGNWQNSNRLMKFSEILQVDFSQQKKILQKILIFILAFLGLLLAKKQPEL